MASTCATTCIAERACRRRDTRYIFAVAFGHRGGNETRSDATKGNRVKRVFLAVAGLLLGAGTAQAATCEDSFVKKGNPVTGLRFVATTTVPNMSMRSAIGQLNGIIASKGYAILAVEPDGGAMLVEPPPTGKSRPFPIEIAADGAGTVRMEAKLRAGMGIPDAAAKAEMCGILTQLKGGKAGDALAAKGLGATSAPGAPVRMSVLRFSQDITGQADKNNAAVQKRYEGRQFTLYGPVSYVGLVGDSYRVEWKLLANVLTDIIPGRASAGLSVNCVLAKGQGAYALQLKPNKHVELTGTFDQLDYGLSSVWLKDCRPVK